ncbi:MAG: hypothetical protein K2P99_05700, partial [Burkholderiales bacterium]|nr:hypothetical protein [Burkholderiales bacterium]
MHDDDSIVRFLLTSSIGDLVYNSVIHLIQKVIGINNFMYKLAVIGKPIDHSLSPSVFQYFSKQFNINLTYDKIIAQNPNDFNKIVYTFFHNNGLALNITSPYKHEAFLSTQIHSSRASFCKTSNFLYLNNDKQIVADTTDGIGILTDIENNNKQTIKNKHILII